MLKYVGVYCDQDVDLLSSGFIKFRQWMKEITNLDICEYKTLPSFSNAYMKSMGVFDGCYELSGAVQRFHQKCIVGGRTMSNSNQKFHVTKVDTDSIYDNTITKDRYGDIINNVSTKSNIQDFDATSLYPSAMARLNGYLKGAPKVIKPIDGCITYSQIQNYDGFYIKIKVLKVGHNLDFPILSYIDNTGIRRWTNDLVNQYIHLDKVTMEDAIKYQNIEFQIITGYYYNEGFNDKIVDTIKYLFNERIIKKREENPIQEVYKLIMNSAYGSVIMKPITEKTVFKSKNDFDVFYQNNHNSIKSWTSPEQNGSHQYKIKCVKTINTHFNSAHLGCQVLSMSKRIMNEVITTAEQLNIKIFYQDTDSMHILEDTIPQLASKYQELYGRELIGKSMGQFHNDFTSSVIKNGIHSTELIVLGKKSYIDRLEGTNDGQTVNDYHIRCKGIPNSVINFKCDESNYSPMKLYEVLADGEKQHMDLTNNSSRSCFKFTNNGNVETIESFPRTLNKNKNKNKNKQ
jgi:hypothetical protein